MNRILRWLGLVSLLLALQACASRDVAGLSDRVPVPGGEYSWGVGQKAEDFAEVEVAQSKLVMYAEDKRYWESIRPTSVPVPRIGGLRTYYRLQARWRLKDGREFTLESVDIAVLMRQYFRTHAMIKTPWEREGRASTVGDGWPMLAHHFKGDTLRLMWVVRINRTPVNERLAPNGAANPWRFETEEYPVATINGVPTSGIDFTQTYDPTR